jgi:hypothetical protein
MMRIRWIRAVWVCAGLAVAAWAAHAQTDMTLSAYRTFNTSTTGNGLHQTPSNSIGGMFEFRHIQTPLIGYELTYSYNRNNQTYAPVTGSCGYFCTYGTLAQTAYQNEVGMDWVFSARVGSFSPFAVAGLGFMITTPATYGYDLNTIVRPAYIYGGGVDWGGSRLGLRLQFRDNVYKAPNVSGAYNTTGVFTHTAEPMVGIYFRLSPAPGS